MFYTFIVDQNAYNCKVSETFIDYKKKLKLSFLVLENNDAIIQLSWGIEPILLVTIILNEIQP